MLRYFKILGLLASGLMVCLLAACGKGDKIKIAGETADGREMTFRFVIYTPGNIKNEVIGTRDGKFEYEASFPDTELPVYIEIYSHDYKLLGIAEALPGSELIMTVDSRGPAGFKVKDTRNDGPESFNEVLTNWLGSGVKIDNATVADFVEKNASSPVAYAVLSTLYDASGDADALRKIAASLMPESRVPYYDNGFYTILNSHLELPVWLEVDSLLCAADTFFFFNPKDYKEIFIAFDIDNSFRNDTVAPELQRLASAGVKKRLVLEHSVAADSTAWRRALRADLRKFRFMNGGDGGEKIKEDKIYWVSTWSGVGPASPFADRFDITDLPYYVVGDSSARIRYAGTSLEAAKDTLYNINKKSKY